MAVQALTTAVSVPTQSWGSYFFDAAKHITPSVLTGYLVGNAPGAIVSGGIALATFFSKTVLDSCSKSLKDNYVFQGVYHVSNIVLPILAVRYLPSTPACLTSEIGEKTCLGADGFKAISSYLAFKSVDFMTSGKNKICRLVATPFAAGASAASLAYIHVIEQVAYEFFKPIIIEPPSTGCSCYFEVEMTCDPVLTIELNEGYSPDQ
ncbi:MAG: hypothetical protein HAW66_10610 [Shewanella sp.]|nr:hypothetical protein [Shewanella sp.]